MAKGNMTIRMEPELKAQAAALFKSLGMDLSTATITPARMLRCGKVSQENYVELTAASAIPNKEIKSPQILRY